MNYYGFDALTIDITKAFFTCWIFYTLEWEVLEVPAWWTVWPAQSTILYVKGFGSISRAVPENVNKI